MDACRNGAGVFGRYAVDVTERKQVELGNLANATYGEEVYRYPRKVNGQRAFRCSLQPDLETLRGIWQRAGELQGAEARKPPSQRRSESEWLRAAQKATRPDPCPKGMVLEDPGDPTCVRYYPARGSCPRGSLAESR
jgi:hypothetical protein